MSDERVHVDSGPVSQSVASYEAAVVVASSSDEPEPDVLFTTDGENWYPATDPGGQLFGPPSPPVHTAVWTGDRFLAVITPTTGSSHSGIMQSSDGKSWSWHPDQRGVFNPYHNVPYLAADGNGVVAAAINGFRSFFFTGTPEDFQVADGVTTVRVSPCAGASGEIPTFGTVTQLPGYGYSVYCDVVVTPDEILHIRIGGMNGYNGGGTPGVGGFHGGGATDIRRGGDSLADRVVIGGGGGGQGRVSTGFGRPTPARGGDAGISGQAGEPGTGCTGGGGATPSTPGSAGTGVHAGQAGTLGTGGDGGVDTFGGGGGGGGLEGGGGGGTPTSESKAAAGGGGSSLSTGINVGDFSSIQYGDGYMQLLWEAIAVSRDYGETWELVESPFGSDAVQALAVFGDTIAAVTYGSLTTPTRYAISTDRGATWTPGAAPPGDEFRANDLIRVGNEWFTGGSPPTGAVLWRSSDLRTWTRCVTPWDSDYAPGAAAYGTVGGSGSIFSIVAGGEDGRSMVAMGASPWNQNAIIVSADGGETWSEVGFVSDAHLAAYGYAIIAVFPDAWHDVFGADSFALDVDLGVGYAFSKWFMSVTRVDSFPSTPHMLQASPDFTQWSEVNLPLITYTTLGAIAATPARRGQQ